MLRRSSGRRRCDRPERRGARGSSGSQREPSLLRELGLHEPEQPAVVGGGILDLLRVLEQEGAGIGIELLLGQEILDQDSPDQLSGSRLVLHVSELSRDQPLDHGLRHPPCELLFSRHDPRRSGYMAVEGVSSRNYPESQEKCALQDAQKGPDARPCPTAAREAYSGWRAAAEGEASGYGESRRA